jgi:hypothetical protein
MGRNWLYYRQTIPSSTTRATGSSKQARPSPDQSSSVEMKKIQSGNILALTDSTSTALVSEMNAKQHKTAIAPIALFILLAAMVVLLVLKTLFWVMLIAFLVAAIIYLLRHHVCIKWIIANTACQSPSRNRLNS